MQKRATIITLILLFVIFTAVTTLVFFLVNSNYNQKSDELTQEMNTVQNELDTLKSRKDVNNYTPTEVVKAFFTEVRSDATDKAKLYLAPDAESMDINATLKLGSDLSNTITGDNFETEDGEDVNVSMEFVLPEGDTTVRTFVLTKYDGAWKITGVTAE